MVQIAEDRSRKLMNMPVKKTSIEQLARERISQNCAYAICFRDVSFHYADGILAMRGRLPSFYMKQVLQTLLQDLDGVERIDNQTDVVNAAGLSSVRSDS